MGLKRWIGRRALSVVKVMGTSYYDDNDGAHNGEHAHAHHHHGTILDLGPGEDVNTSGIAVWMIGLICFTIALEKMLHHLTHALGERDSPGNQMISKIKDELMLMGCISFLITMFQEFVPIGHPTLLCFEFAHTLLFISALCLVLMAFGLLNIADSVYKRMRAMDKAETVHLLTSAEKNTFTTIQVANTVVEGLDAARFQCMRHAFLRSHHLPLADSSGFGGFNFPEYLHRSVYHFILELLEVSVKSWQKIIGLVALNGARAWLADYAFGSLSLSAPFIEMASFAVFGWLLLGVQLFLVSQARTHSRRVLSNAGVHDDGQGAGGDPLYGLHKALEVVVADLVDSTKLKDRKRTLSLDGPIGQNILDAEMKLKKQISEGAKPEGTVDLGKGVYVGGSGAAEDFVGHVACLLTVGSFYLAVLLMRYVGLSAVVGVAHHHAIALLLFVAALVPLIPAWWILHELIDKTSFNLAVMGDFFGPSNIETITKESERDSAERETFKVNFVNHYQGSAAIKDESESQKKWNKIASKAQDIQRIYNRYVDPATGDMEPDGLNRLVDRIYTDSKVKNDEKLRLWVQMDTDLQGGISYTEFTAFLGLNSVPTKGIAAKLALKAASKVAHKIHEHAHNHVQNGGKLTLADVSDKVSNLYNGKGAGKGSKSPARRGLAKPDSKPSSHPLVAFTSPSSVSASEKASEGAGGTGMATNRKRPHASQGTPREGQSEPRHESDSEAEYENRRDEAVGRRGAKPMTPVQEKEQKKDR